MTDSEPDVPSARLLLEAGPRFQLRSAAPHSFFVVRAAGTCHCDAERRARQWRSRITSPFKLDKTLEAALLGARPSS
ncbi:MAG: hypothetical protein JSV80_17375 [Acidobacteriota bacterium]|nr:MAG: hypothetical protein JSV80_17375 [Acidobacteriota bacterium]